MLTQQQFWSTSNCCDKFSPPICLKFTDYIIYFVRLLAIPYAILLPARAVVLLTLILRHEFIEYGQITELYVTDYLYYFQQPQISVFVSLLWEACAPELKLSCDFFPACSKVYSDLLCYSYQSWSLYFP